MDSCLLPLSKAWSRFALVLDSMAVAAEVHCRLRVVYEALFVARAEGSYTEPGSMTCHAWLLAAAVHIAARVACADSSMAVELVDETECTADGAKDTTESAASSAVAMDLQRRAVVVVVVVAAELVAETQRRSPAAGHRSAEVTLQTSAEQLHVVARGLPTALLCCADIGSVPKD